MIITIRHPTGSLLFFSLLAPVILGELKSWPRLLPQRDKTASTSPREEDLPVISLRPSFSSFLIKLVDIFRRGQDGYLDRGVQLPSRSCTAKCATVFPWRLQLSYKRSSSPYSWTLSQKRLNSRNKFHERAKVTRSPEIPPSPNPTFTITIFRNVSTKLLFLSSYLLTIVSIKRVKRQGGIYIFCKTVLKIIIIFLDK